MRLAAGEVWLRPCLFSQKQSETEDESTFSGTDAYAILRQLLAKLLTWELRPFTNLL